MVFISLTNFYSAWSFAVGILLSLLFFVGSFLCLFLYFMSVREQDDEKKCSK